MEENSLEFFKLDKIDRKVFFWLVDHVSIVSVKSWIEYIADEYKRNKRIHIDIEVLFRETVELIEHRKN